MCDGVLCVCDTKSLCAGPMAQWFICNCDTSSQRRSGLYAIVTLVKMGSNINNYDQPTITLMRRGAWRLEVRCVTAVFRLAQT